jgi:hypothetical protein
MYEKFDATSGGGSMVSTWRRLRHERVLGFPPLLYQDPSYHHPASSSLRVEAAKAASVVSTGWQGEWVHSVGGGVSGTAGHGSKHSPLFARGQSAGGWSITLGATVNNVSYLKGNLGVYFVAFTTTEPAPAGRCNRHP